MKVIHSKKEGIRIEKQEFKATIVESAKKTIRYIRQGMDSEDSIASNK